MKTTLIALATVLGMSGAAFAMDAADKGSTAPIAQTDTLTTGSVQQSSHDLTVPADGGFASEAGITVNPNFLPNFR